MGLTIALDFDDTFTADPTLWCGFILDAMDRGHQVYCVTARDNSESQYREVSQALPPAVGIIFCASNPKRKHALIEHEIAIDIWIDDYPEWIGESGVSEFEREGWEKRIDDLKELVAEARHQRDLAEQKAKESVQAEMAELRRRLAAYQSGDRMRAAWARQHLQQNGQRDHSVREIQGDDCVAL